MTEDATAEERRLTAENWARRGKNWDDWADRMAKFSGGLNEPLIDAAGVEAGFRVLDLASGAGEPALTLAGVVGAEGHVTASDFVPQMLAGARRRADAAGIGNIDFEIADMENLPFGDQSFDAVTCRLGLMYTPSPATALGEARRVLKPGRSAAFLVWGPHDDNTQFIVLDTVFKNVMDLDPHEGAFEPTRFGAAGSLAAVFTEAGFHDVEERELYFSPRVDPAARFWRAQVALRLGDGLADLSDAERDQLDQAMAAEFERFRDGDRIQLQVHARLGIGRA